MDLLYRYLWPGNVRELKNLIERALIICAGDSITAEHIKSFFPTTLEEHMSAPDKTSLEIHQTLREARGDFEKAFILRKLEDCDWNVTKTAEAIGIERSNLHKKLRLYGIDAKHLRQ